ncbi:hypothetical protein OESDEN_17894 [Oesophagostomum dentatum]|uniref:KHDC4/BBP-like KH-domain type I domain-containing protein n=1 Tax=Oesophagostomum dentatum TaxID=61180 RepID=A0A0B1SFT7_OESDE|nr:hypothetical protein OESDEN_17894 [Oesophagostomum dentatum]
MNEKVFIPKLHGRRIKGSKCNFIGRIIGPAGMSVKQLESDTGCHILIRGKGSVKVNSMLDGVEHLQSSHPQKLRF